jgi:glycosyltransferase involved in cell wall biosynthesis
MKVIGLMPVRNEAWIVDRTLTALTAVCDHVLVADQHSDDGTRRILARHAPKVQVMDNDLPTHSTRVRWQLLEAARDYAGQNLLLFTDADEVLSANILEGDLLRRLTSLPPGTAVRVELVNLWRSPRLWRRDGSVWSDRWMEIGLRDDRRVRYGPAPHPADHNLRVPPCPRSETFKELKLLHFQFVQFDRMLSKQRRYRAMEAVELGRQRAPEINLRYCITRDERRCRLAPIRREWTDGWTRRGVDLTHLPTSELYWYDVDVLRRFAERGAGYFAPVDLWTVNWERKRQLALADGRDGLPSQPVRDPRSLEQRLYHAYLRRFYRTPPWRDPLGALGAPWRWARRGLRAVGLRRRHLQRFGLTGREPKPKGVPGP